MCKCRQEIKTPFCGRPGCEWPAQRIQSEDEFVAQYNHYIAKRVAREVWRSRHHKGMQAGMPTVQLDSVTVENLLSRWKIPTTSAEGAKGE